MQITETLLRGQHGIDEIEHLESPIESTYIFARDFETTGNVNEVNFAVQHFGTVHQLAIAIFNNSHDLKVKGKVELSPDEAKLLRDFLLQQFPLSEQPTFPVTY